MELIKFYLIVLLACYLTNDVISKPLRRLKNGENSTLTTTGSTQKPPKIRKGIKYHFLKEKLQGPLIKKHNFKINSPFKTKLFKLERRNNKSAKRHTNNQLEKFRSKHVPFIRNLRGMSYYGNKHTLSTWIDHRKLDTNANAMAIPSENIIRRYEPSETEKTITSTEKVTAIATTTNLITDKTTVTAETVGSSTTAVSTSGVEPITATDDQGSSTTYYQHDQRYITGNHSNDTKNAGGRYAEQISTNVTPASTEYRGDTEFPSTRNRQKYNEQVFNVIGEYTTNQYEPKFGQRITTENASDEPGIGNFTTVTTRDDPELGQQITPETARDEPELEQQITTETARDEPELGHFTNVSTRDDPELGQQITTEHTRAEKEHEVFTTIADRNEPVRGQDFTTESARITKKGGNISKEEYSTARNIDLQETKKQVESIEESTTVEQDIKEQILNDYEGTTKPRSNFFKENFHTARIVEPTTEFFILGEQTSLPWNKTDNKPEEYEQVEYTKNPTVFERDGADKVQQIEESTAQYHDGIQGEELNVSEPKQEPRILDQANPNEEIKWNEDVTAMDAKEDTHELQNIQTTEPNETRESIQYWQLSELSTGNIKDDHSITEDYTEENEGSDEHSTSEQDLIESIVYDRSNNTSIYNKDDNDNTLVTNFYI